MNDEPTVQPARKGGGFLGILWLVALGLSVYVLSVGPVARHYNKQTPPAWVLKFYAPLIFLTDNVRPAERFFDWYVKLWT